MKRIVLLLMILACMPLIMGLGVSLWPGGGGSTTAGIAGEQPWTFVSIPDFLNVDVGDLSGRQACPTGPYPCYDGSSNSTSADWEEIMDYTLDHLMSENPDIVFVAGDLVMGEWHLDVDTTGTFGPVTSEAEKQSAITAAGNFYYGIWKARFTDRGITADKIFPVLGDHEVGDDPWGAGKYELVPTWKAVFSSNLTAQFTDTPASGSGAGTAYAAQHKNLKIISLDLFRQDDPGVAGPILTTDATQDAWLASTLSDAGNDETVDWIIAQGHLPFAVGDEIRWRSSSQLVTVAGTSETAWTTLTAAQDKVALYMCGEHHAPTALIDSGLMQLCHGILTGYNMQGTYLLGTVYPDRIELELKMFYQHTRGGLGKLWQVSPPEIERPASFIVNPRDAESAQGVIGTSKPFTVGRATIRKAGRKIQYTDLWGVFAGPYFMNYSADGAATPYQLDGSGNKTAGINWPGTSDWDWKYRGSVATSVTRLDNAPIPLTPDNSPSWIQEDCAAGSTVYQRVGNAIGNGARHRVFFSLGDRSDQGFPASFAVTLHSGDIPGAGTLEDTVTIDAATCVGTAGNQCECDAYPASSGSITCSVTLTENAASAGDEIYIDWDPADGGGCFWLLDSSWIDTLQTIVPVIATAGKSCNTACAERVPHGDVAPDYYRCSHDDTIALDIGGAAGDELTASYCSLATGIRICGCY